MVVLTPQSRSASTSKSDLNSHSSSISSSTKQNGRIPTHLPSTVTTRSPRYRSMSLATTTATKTITSSTPESNPKRTPSSLRNDIKSTPTPAHTVSHKRNMNQASKLKTANNHFQTHTLRRSSAAVSLIPSEAQPRSNSPTLSSIDYGSVNYAPHIPAKAKFVYANGQEESPPQKSPAVSSSSSVSSIDTKSDSSIDDSTTYSSAPRLSLTSLGDDDVDDDEVDVDVGGVGGSETYSSYRKSTLANVDMNDNARINRKILDLEISNTSLSAYNRTLEREMHIQSRELRSLKRWLASPSSGIVCGNVDIVQALRDFESDTEADADVDHGNDNDNDVDDDKTVLLQIPRKSESSMTLKPGQNDTIIQLEHEWLSVSHGLNSAISKCISMSDDLIKQAKSALIQDFDQDFDQGFDQDFDQSGDKNYDRNLDQNISPDTTQDPNCNSNDISEDLDAALEMYESAVNNNTAPSEVNRRINPLLVTPKFNSSSDSVRTPDSVD
ncbi:uncharacterized protein V1516DRAFT_680328 [Lipomyces oligophaga]|uniref:uncharacterized protein n=1 Tax=Lipomyces oligophaga TaxID=45792 RepID=UPI0034CFDAD7